jgi:hypothetical protein
MPLSDVTAVWAPPGSSMRTLALATTSSPP